ncbi:hypothetical protein D3C80_1292230 [compost metagenome]
MQGIQTAVYADTNVVIATILAVACDLAYYLGQFFIVGEDRATIAIATQRFAGEKACAGNGGQVAGALAFIGCAEALCGILDYRNTVFGCYGIDGIKIRTLAIQ